MELETLYLDPEAQVLRVAVAPPGVPAEPQRAQRRQRDQRADVEHSQVVAAHVQHLQRRVLRERVRVDLRQPRVICHPQHHHAGQRAKRPVLDLRQAVERQIQVGELAQVAKSRLGDLRQRVVAAVQVHQVRQVVELQRRKVADPVIGDDQLPGGQREVHGEVA